MADTTLQGMRNTIRRITRSPSLSILTNPQIDEYINQFALYDMPENIRIMALRRTLRFYTQPNVDFYQTEPTNTLDPLYEFKDRYVNVYQPIFFAGIQGRFYTDRSEFYAQWPQTNNIADTLLRGDGLITAFAGTAIGKPMLQNNVVFSTVDAAGTSVLLVDYPFNN